MVSTVVELCNHALQQLGADRIASLTEANERARVCNLMYEQTRDSVLAAFAWPFATTRIACAAVDDTNLTEYDYQHQLPSDYVKLVDILDDESYKKINGADFFIEGDRIYSDYSPLYIRYVKRIEDPTKFPELFVDCLAMTLAAKIAPRLTQNTQLALTASQLAGNALAIAKAELKKDSLPRPKRSMSIAGIN